MSTPIRVVGQLSLAGLMVAPRGCSGASQEQEVTLESTDARLATALAYAWVSECLPMVCRLMWLPTRPVLRTR